jgi:hypothetical protein
VPKSQKQLINCYNGSIAPKYLASGSIDRIWALRVFAKENLGLQITHVSPAVLFSMKVNAKKI